MIWGYCSKQCQALLAEMITTSERRYVYLTAISKINQKSNLTL